MKNKKWQIPLTVISGVLIITLAFSIFQIVGLSGNKNIKKKVIKHTNLEYADKDFDDFIDDVIDNFDNNWSDDNGFDDSDNGFDDNDDSEDPADNSSSEITDDMNWDDDDDSTGGGEDDGDLTKFVSPIQKDGTAAANAAVRNINVTTAKTVYKDFWSLGGNWFPMLLSNVGVSVGYNSVAWEFERQKIINSRTAYTRTLVNMDVIITNTESNPKRADYQNNKDYINYMSGVYDFENDQAESFWKTFDMFKKSGTLVMLNTGWKTPDRIQSWYPARSDDAANSAPYDIKAFVKANIAWLLECKNRGYDMVKYIYFGNEVNWGGDFRTHEDSIKYHTVLVTAMTKAIEYAQKNSVTYKCIDKNGQTQTRSGKLNSDVQMITSDFAPNSAKLVEWAQTLNKSLETTLGNSRPTEHSVHRYYDKRNGKKGNVYDYRDYDSTYTILNYLRERMGRPFINEFFASPALCDSDLILSREHYLAAGDWDTSYTSYFIAAANTGAHGLANWQYGSSLYGSRFLESNFADGMGSLYSVGNTASDYKVTTNYRLAALLQRYVPAHSDVLMNTWEGDDLRVSSFKLEDGNYTFVVEAKKTDAARTINLKLDKAVGKLYRYHFVESLSDTDNRKLQGTLIRSDKSFASAASITDTIDGEYGVYVYSTKAPAKQVELDKGVETIKKTDTIDISAKLLDCGNNSNIKWEISAASKKNGKSLAEKDLIGDAKTKGSISAVGLTCRYTPGANAASGDSIAIRATLLNADGTESDTYSVAVIFIE